MARQPMLKLVTSHYFVHDVPSRILEHNIWINVQIILNMQNMQIGSYDFYDKLTTYMQLQFSRGQLGGYFKQLTLHQL